MYYLELSAGVKKATEPAAYFRKYLGGGGMLHTTKTINTWTTGQRTSKTSRQPCCVSASLPRLPASPRAIFQGRRLGQTSHDAPLSAIDARRCFFFNGPVPNEATPALDKGETPLSLPAAGHRQKLLASFLAGAPRSSILLLPVQLQASAI